MPYVLDDCHTFPFMLSNSLYLHKPYIFMLFIGCISYMCTVRYVTFPLLPFCFCIPRVSALCILFCPFFAGRENGL